LLLMSTPLLCTGSQGTGSGTPRIASRRQLIGNPRVSRKGSRRGAASTTNVHTYSPEGDVCGTLTLA
jgi:hypothetical protein